MLMNEKRKFNCKFEEVPAVAGYLAQRLRADLVDFIEFSDVYSEDYITRLVAQINVCNQLKTPDAFTKEIKAITAQIDEKAKTLRKSLNKVEVYLGMADGQMTITADSMGAKQLRDCINNGNSEGIVKQSNNLLGNINSNLAVLQTKGLKLTLVEEMTQLTNDIETLGNDQNFRITERNRHTDENVGEYNKLWDINTFILDTGRALYRGVNATKLDDYTLATILKRIDAEGTNKKDEAPKA